MLVHLDLSRSELLGIRWEDIDYDNQILHIRYGVADVQNSITGKMEIIIDAPKTDYRIRDIPLPEDLMRSLKDKPKTVLVGANQHRNRMGKSVPTEFVFHNAQGRVCSPRTWSRRY